jgi:cyclase
MVLTTRRQFVAASSGAAAALLLCRPLLARTARGDTYFEVKEAGGHARILLGEGGNTLVVMGDGESLLIDCKNAPFGTTLRREAAPGAPPLRYVVNTHHHADHTGGNHAFRDVTLFAHEKAAPRIPANVERYVGAIRGGPGVVGRSTRPQAAKEAAMAEVQALAERADQLQGADFTPTQTVGDEHEFTVGGVRVVLRHFGPGHTDNDLVVHVPDLNLVHTGDLLFRRLHPFIDRPAGATTVGWQKSLDAVIALCDDRTIVVPGHGGEAELTDVTALREQKDYFDKLRRIVEYAKNNDGMSKEDAAKIQTGAFEGYGAQDRFGRAVQAVYEELSE